MGETYVLGKSVGSLKEELNHNPWGVKEAAAALKESEAREMVTQEAMEERMIIIWRIEKLG